MSKPKAYPPYRLEGEGEGTVIVDAQGNDVAVCIWVSSHYGDVFPGNEPMKLLCDALNKSARKEES